MLCVQLVKYLNVNRPMTVVWSTYGHCAYSLFNIAFMFVRVVVVFAQLGYLVFGGANLAFLTIPMSM